MPNRKKVGRLHNIGVPFTDDEWDVLQAFCDKRQVPKGRYTRQAILAALQDDLSKMVSASRFAESEKQQESERQKQETSNEKAPVERR